MSLDGNRVGGKRDRSRSQSPRRHRHEKDRHKRRSKEREIEREREEVKFDPHKEIKQEPLSPPPHHRRSPATHHASPPRGSHRRSPAHHRSPAQRDASPVRERFHSGRDRPHSGRNRFHDRDDSPRRERRYHRDRHHYDSRRPIKQEPEDRQDPSQSRERARNDAHRRRVRWEREANDNSRGSSGNGATGIDDQNWGTGTGTTGARPVERERPNFELSGKLTEDTNMFRGVVIKYNEPPEARKPKRQWRLYPFKGDESLPVLHIHRQSAYLIGRNRMIADFPVDHPSCSQQHAVLQYRFVSFTRENGTTGHRVSPYIIDLNSTNGTYLNNKQIEPQKYVELREKDVLKFGFSTREYVLLHAKADTSEVVNEDESE